MRLSKGSNQFSGTKLEPAFCHCHRRASFSASAVCAPISQTGLRPYRLASCKSARSDASIRLAGGARRAHYLGLSYRLRAPNHRLCHCASAPNQRPSRGAPERAISSDRDLDDSIRCEQMCDPIAGSSLRPAARALGAEENNRRLGLQWVPPAAPIAGASAGSSGARCRKWAKWRRSVVCSRQISRWPAERNGAGHCKASGGWHLAGALAGADIEAPAGQTTIVAAVVVFVERN